MCKLHKAIYGLKQALRPWFEPATSFSMWALFVVELIHQCLSFMAWWPVLLLYVDDIILTCDNPQLLSSFISTRGKEFDVTNLCDLHYFLGTAASRSSFELFLSQRKYALDLLKKAAMLYCKPMSTLLFTTMKLLSDSGTLFSDPYFIEALLEDCSISLSHGLIFPMPWISFVSLCIDLMLITFMQSNGYLDT